MVTVVDTTVLMGSGIFLRVCPARGHRELEDTKILPPSSSLLMGGLLFLSKCSGIPQVSGAAPSLATSPLRLSLCRLDPSE